MNRWLKIVGVVVMALTIAFTVVGQGETSETIVIGPSERGVVFNRLTGLLDETLQPGTHEINPTVQEVTVYFVGMQTLTLADDAGNAIEARTTDNQTVALDLTLIYQIADVNQIHINWQERYTTELIPPVMRGTVRDMVAEFRAEDIYGQARIELRGRIAEALAPRLEDQGLALIDFSIEYIRFSEGFSGAMEARQAAEQQITVVRLQADQARTLAQGEADAALMRAQAEAQRLQIVSELLAANPMMIYYLYIQALPELARSGALILLPSDAIPSFDVAALMSGNDTGE